MNKITPQVSQLAAKYQAATVRFLILIALSFSMASTSVAATGYPLIDTLTGSFGDASNFMKDKVETLVEDSGILAAATEAKTTLDGLANGAVPVIDDLSDPYQDKAEEAISNALGQVQSATNILNNVASQGAIDAIDFITTSPLFADADFGITLPTGRIRVRRQGTEVSLCMTTVGPFGSIIISGISNAQQLCHFNDPRMANPTKSLLAFTYMAAGHTHIRTNLVLIPNLAEDLTLLPAPINAETYIKTVGDQWVQIKLAGADPKSIELEAKFEVGVKANVSYYVDVEAEGEAALKFSLKPIYAAEVIRSTGEVMLNRATALGLNMELSNLSSDTADILKTGLQHLSDIESDYGEGFGDVSLDIKLTGGIGLGFLDTAISAISANSTFNLTAPLTSFIEMRAGLLEEFLDIGLGMATVNLNLGTDILQGNQDAIANFRLGVQQASSDFVTGVLDELLLLTTKIKSVESTFTLAALGDADKQSIVLYESGLKLPVGLLSNNLQNTPNVLGDAFAAVSYLMLSALNPALEITPDVWTELEGLVVPGIEFTLRARNPLTASLFGFKDADLLDTLKSIATIREILISLVNSSLSESLNDVRTKVDEILTVANANDAVVDWINGTFIEKSIAFGTNGSLGAEAVAELGVQVELKGGVSGSLFLLLLDIPGYVPPEDNLLAIASIPVEFSLDAGASVGEGVELTVDAGGKIALNAFELTATHWDGDLPSSALMEVAGFSILEFDGTVAKDESFEGSGYLMLPFGGIVSANFMVDSNGNVIPDPGNTWSGGLELGPLGDYPFISGTLHEDGLHGSIDSSILGSSFSADFILNSSGLLLGSYVGDITIAGHELLAASISLNSDGEFEGSYEGDISLGGFVSTSTLAFNNDGITGSSYLNVLGSELISSDIVITRSGYISGTFTGDIVVGSHTLSAVSLSVVNGGLIGTARMDLPGIAGAEVELRIFNGKVTAFYQGDLFNGFITQASFAITHTEIIMSSNIDTSSFQTISGQVLDLLITASSSAQSRLATAESDLIFAQSAVSNAEQALDTASAQLSADLAAAQQLVIDKLADAQTALNRLNDVIATIEELNNLYDGLLNSAQITLNNAQDKLDDASALVTYYNNKITALDNWYNGLSLYNKGVKLVYYTAKRAEYVALRAAAIIAKTAAQVALDTAQVALNVLNSELADLLNPLSVSKAALQLTYNTANIALTQAQASLAAIEADIAADIILAPLYVTLNIANGGLVIAQAAVNELSSLISMATYFASEGAESAFSVLGANTTVALNPQMLLSSTLEIDARITYLGQQGQIHLMFDPADPVNSFIQAMTSLQSGSLVLSKSDTTAPSVSATQPAEWVSDQTLILLSAKDETGGTGVASITYNVTTDQVVTNVTVAGSAAYVLIDTEGLSSLNFFATDIAGNTSETSSININIDHSGPQISVTDSGINQSVYEVVINATDLLGSGIDYISISATGAEPFSERIELTDEVVIALTQDGMTTLLITAVDVAGNITTLTRDVTVPDLFVNDGDGITNNDGNPTSGGTSNANSSSGAALGPLWLLLAGLMICLRGSPLQINRHH